MSVNLIGLWRVEGVMFAMFGLLGMGVILFYEVVRGGLEWARH